MRYQASRDFVARWPFRLCAMFATTTFENPSQPLEADGGVNFVRQDQVGARGQEREERAQEGDAGEAARQGAHGCGSWGESGGKSTHPPPVEKSQN